MFNKMETRILLVKLKSALADSSRIPYEELREEIIRDYSYDVFRELQYQAFCEVFNVSTTES